MATVSNKLVQSQLVTNAITGFSQNGFIWNRILPTVNVNSEKITVPTYGKEHMKLYNTERALKSDVQIANTDDWTSTDITLIENAFGFEIDSREVRNASSQQNLLMEYGKKTAASIALAKEKAAADLVFNESNVTQTTTLSGTDQWSDVDDSDPLGDIRTGISTVRASTGKRANTLVLGSSVFDKLDANQAITDRLKYTGQVLTVEVLAKMLNIPKILIGEAVYDNDGTMTDVWGKHCLVAYTTDSPAKEEPSLGYTWQLANSTKGLKWSSGSGKLLYVGAEDTYKQSLSMATAGYFIKNAIA